MGRDPTEQPTPDYISGRARMGVFGASGQARTFDFEENDVGYVPFAMGHYVEKTGPMPLRFLEIFKSSYYADVSLEQWIALTPPELVSAHLKLGPQFMARYARTRYPSCRIRPEAQSVRRTLFGQLLRSRICGLIAAEPQVT